MAILFATSSAHANQRSGILESQRGYQESPKFGSTQSGEVFRLSVVSVAGIPGSANLVETVNFKQLSKQLTQHNIEGRGLRLAIPARQRSGKTILIRDLHHSLPTEWISLKLDTQRATLLPGKSFLRKLPKQTRSAVERCDNILDIVRTLRQQEPTRPIFLTVDEAQGALEKGSGGKLFQELIDLKDEKLHVLLVSSRSSEEKVANCPLRKLRGAQFFELKPEPIESIRSMIRSVGAAGEIQFEPGVAEVLHQRTKGSLFQINTVLSELEGKLPALGQRSISVADVERAAKNVSDVPGYLVKK